MSKDLLKPLHKIVEVVLNIGEAAHKTVGAVLNIVGSVAVETVLNFVEVVHKIVEVVQHMVEAVRKVVGDILNIVEVACVEAAHIAMQDVLETDH